MKGVITRTTESESKATYETWIDLMVKEKKNTFIEKKKPQTGKKYSFKVESSRKHQQMVQRIAERKSKEEQEKEKAQKEAEEFNAKDWQEKAIFIATNLIDIGQKYAYENPTNFLILVCIFLISTLWFKIMLMSWRIDSLTRFATSQAEAMQGMQALIKQQSQLLLQSQ